MRTTEFCFCCYPPITGAPNRLGAKPFYLLFQHRAGKIGEITELKEAMEMAREYAENSQDQYVVMKAVAILRPSKQPHEEIMLGDTRKEETK